MRTPARVTFATSPSPALKVTSHKKFMHIGGKAILCTTCGQSRDPRNLKKHMMIHSKVVKRSPRKKHV